jgi:hypothetical protein
MQQFTSKVSTSAIHLVSMSSIVNYTRLASTDVTKYK